jgi:hypothetical protein
MSFGCGVVEIALFGSVPVVGGLDGSKVYRPQYRYQTAYQDLTH